MTKQNINSKKGFTIIEVVLVLAIAGLIFLMVFVALPALQRSQRDTARRNDMARVSTSLVQYQTNHSSSASSLPDETSYYDGGAYTNSPASQFIQRYMNSGTGDGTNTFKDPGGETYKLFNTTWSDLAGGQTFPGGVSLVAGKTSDSYTVGSEFKNHVIYIITGATCDGEDAIASGNNNYAVLYRLEGAGVYCIDDQ